MTMGRNDRIPVRIMADSQPRSIFCMVLSCFENDINKSLPIENCTMEDFKSVQIPSINIDRNRNVLLHYVNSSR